MSYRQQVRKGKLSAKELLEFLVGQGGSATRLRRWLERRIARMGERA